MPGATRRVPRAAPRRRASQVALPAEALDLGEPVTATEQDPPEHHVRAALDLRLRALLKHDPGTRSGADPENLHQMRVSVRRMRAVLKAARPLLDRKWADGLRAELGWLGRALGPVRDLDVLLMRLRGEAAQFSKTERDDAETLLAALEDERTATRAALLAALASGRYMTLLHRLATAASQPVPAPPAGKASRPALESLVRKEFQRLHTAVVQAGAEPPDEVLHELRILGKRLRYTTELAGPALGAPSRALLRATTAMQDVLGDHQDACVAQQRVRALLAGMGDAASPAVAFVAGRLVERAELRRVENRATWPDAWRNVQAAAP